MHNYNIPEVTSTPYGMIILVFILFITIIYVIYRITDPDKYPEYKYKPDLPYVVQPQSTIIVKPHVPKPPVRPPRASFFGRLDGESLDIIGNYEEKYVPIIDMYEWKRQKERQEALDAGILDEKPKKVIKPYDWRAKSHPKPLLEDID